jgi:serine/threonine protein kinase/Tol biopolymer transport system component
MSLTPGLRFGPYEIIELIGAGGMGEVYRARDARLKRDVAVKVLPAAWSGDTDRARRFQREAELLAALNHPNIAAIYGVEDIGGATALVMELVEGPTLADLLAVRALPARTALPIVRQIADALDAAHERGIVHRDLKPANIKVRDDGTVKVLDFGLGKALDPHDDGQTGRDDGNTRTGAILGTAAYMSPEQLRGLPVDRRTDIWAFGCVVYEMLAGHRTFDNATGSDTIAAILDREPDWSRLPGADAKPLEGLIRRCLQKDRKLRLRDIGDARAELDTAASPNGPAPGTPGRFISNPWLTAAAGLVLIALSVAATLGLDGLMAGSSTPNRDSEPRQTELVRATADQGVAADPALSEDGALLAYASDRAGGDNLDIWVQQTSGSAPLQLTSGAFDEREPAFFPDGGRLVYRAEGDGGGIYVVPAFGGQQPRLLAAGGRRPRVSPDGLTVAYWTGPNVGFTARAGAYRAFTVPASGGEARELTGFTGARYPVWAPDGRSLLVLASQAEQPRPDTYDWWRVPLDGAQPIRVHADELLGAAGISFDEGYVRPEDWRDDRVLFSDGNYLWSMRLDRTTSSAANVERLTFGTNVEFQAATAASGLIAVASATLTNSVWALPIDAAKGISVGPPRRLTPGTRASASRDGQLMAYRTVLPQPTILVTNVATRDVIDLGIAGSAFGPAISPDGALVAYEDIDSVRVVPTRGGTPRTLCESCSMGDWLPDSRAFVVVGRDDKAGRLTQISVEDGDTRDLVVSPGRGVDRPFPSPDGRWLTFRRGDSRGGVSIIVAPLSGDASLLAESWFELVPPEDDARPIGWSPDAALVYFVSARDSVRCLYAQRIDSATGMAVGDPFVVHHFHGGRTVLRQGFNVFSTGPGNAVGRDFVLYDISDVSANIWLLQSR